MIQRIQSVYLFIAALALGAMFYFPLAGFIGGDLDQLVYYIYKVVSEIPGDTPDVPYYFIYPILVLNILTIILSVSAIFRYKHLGAQMKMIRAAIFLIMVMVAVFFFYCVPLLEEASGALVEYNKIAVSLPLVALVFLLLANRGILSDIKLLKSADRLR
jgi:glucan phosphoethanolaminetransferase (alkaline phosphatase superfamily)